MDLARPRGADFDPSVPSSLIGDLYPFCVLVPGVLVGAVLVGAMLVRVLVPVPVSVVVVVSRLAFRPSLGDVLDPALHVEREPNRRNDQPGCSQPT